MTHTLSALREWRHRRWAKLPWEELEAEAARQRCSPADIFFDRAGRTTGVIEAVRPPVHSQPRRRDAWISLLAVQIDAPDARRNERKQR